MILHNFALLLSLTVAAKLVVPRSTNPYYDVYKTVDSGIWPGIRVYGNPELTKIMDEKQKNKSADDKTREEAMKMLSLLDEYYQEATVEIQWQRLGAGSTKEEVMKMIVAKAKSGGISERDYSCLNKLLRTKPGKCVFALADGWGLAPLPAIGRLVKCLIAIRHDQIGTRTEEMDRLGYSLGAIYIQNAKPKDWSDLAGSYYHQSDARRFLEYIRNEKLEGTYRYSFRQFEELFAGNVSDDILRKEMAKELMNNRPAKAIITKNFAEMYSTNFISAMEIARNNGNDEVTAICEAATKLTPIMMPRMAGLFFPWNGFYFDKLIQRFDNLQVPDMADLLRDATISAVYPHFLPKTITPACATIANKTELLKMEDQWDMCTQMDHRLVDPVNEHNRTSLVESIPDILAMAADPNSQIDFLTAIAPEVFILRKAVELIKEEGEPNDKKFSELDRVLESLSPDWIAANGPANYTLVKEILQNVKITEQRLLEARDVLRKNDNTFDEKKTLELDASEFIREFGKSITKQAEGDITAKKTEGDITTKQPEGDYIITQSWGDRDALNLANDIKRAMAAPTIELRQVQEFESRAKKIAGNMSVDPKIVEFCQNMSIKLKKYEKRLVALQLDVNFMECQWNRVNVDKSSKDGLLKAYFEAFINTMKSGLDNDVVHRYFATYRAHSVASFMRLLKSDKRLIEFSRTFKQKVNSPNTVWAVYAEEVDQAYKKSLNMSATPIWSR